MRRQPTNDCWPARELPSDYTKDRSNWSTTNNRLGSEERVGLQHVRSAPQIKHKFSVLFECNIYFIVHSIKYSSLTQICTIHNIDWMTYLPNIRYSLSQPFSSGSAQCGDGFIFLIVF